MPRGVFVRTVAHRAALSAAHKGIGQSPETRAKISASTLGRRKPEAMRQRLATTKTRHGHAGIPNNIRRSRTYVSWEAMVARCNNERHPDWANYGGRGIKVCDRWNDPRGRGYANAGFEAFIADMGERPPGTTLDRINVDGHYEPGNVRWATPKEQRANQRPRRVAA